MFLIWGKHTYGAVDRCGGMAVKTSFGHLWYVPFFPIGSYYVSMKSDAAFPLRKMHWGSVLCGYARVWVPILLLLALAVMQGADTLAELVLLGVGIVVLLAALVVAYTIDKKLAHPDGLKIRQLMRRYFGEALDPFACETGFAHDIDEAMRAGSDRDLPASWYRHVLDDKTADQRSVELAVLRARCDYDDADLQLKALRRLHA